MGRWPRVGRPASFAGAFNGVWPLSWCRGAAAREARRPRDDRTSRAGTSGAASIRGAQGRAWAGSRACAASIPGTRSACARGAGEGGRCAALGVTTGGVGRVVRVGGVWGMAALSPLVAVRGRAGRRREKGGGGRKRKEEKEKGERKRKREREKKRERKGDRAGGIQGGDRVRTSTCAGR